MSLGLRIRRAIAARAVAMRSLDEAAPAGWDDAIRTLYAACHRHRRHGLRDERPQHWRRYLERAQEDAPGAGAGSDS
ncbi:MAG: hypothetical protein AB7Q97_04165 [Gammaproteobacteria bacterium]